jgi:hypothetical protein
MPKEPASTVVALGFSVSSGGPCPRPRFGRLLARPGFGLEAERYGELAAEAIEKRLGFHDLGPVPI